MRTLTINETCEISAGGSVRAVMAVGMLGQILSFPFGQLVAQNDWLFGFMIGAMYFAISSSIVLTTLNMLTTQPSLDD